MLAFLLGGARSGKSALAQRLVAATGAPTTVVVTAEPGDDEMMARIARHRVERDPSWCTVEAPRALLAACDAIDDESVVLIDCVSFWVANRVMDGDGEDAVADEARRLAAWAAARRAWVVAVSNEVGAGVVPDNELARRFRDALGRANAALCAHATHAWYVAASRVVTLEPPPEAL